MMMNDHWHHVPIFITKKTWFDECEKYYTDFVTMFMVNICQYIFWTVVLMEKGSTNIKSKYG